MTDTTVPACEGATDRAETRPSGPARPDRDADLVAQLRRQESGAVEALVAR